MKLAFRLVLLAALIAAGVWLWTVLFPSPEKIIRRRLAQAAADVSFRQGQNPLLVANRAEKLAALCSTNVMVRVQGREHIQHTFTSRQEIVQAAASAHQEFNSLQVQFLDVTVSVAPDKQSATAELTLKAQAAGRPDLMVQELRVTFQRIGGEWLITRVETVRTLSLNRSAGVKPSAFGPSRIAPGRRSTLHPSDSQCQRARRERPQSA